MNTTRKSFTIEGDDATLTAMKTPLHVDASGQYSFLGIADEMKRPAQDRKHDFLAPATTPKKNAGMFQNHDGKVKTNEWLTPPEIIRSLGEFDLDPCAPVVRPWSMAKHHYTILDDGLLQQWFGRVWLNPPYDRGVIEAWMKLMSQHGNGIALTFARTDRNSFHDYVFQAADSILFIRQRLTFYTVEGKRAPANGGAPSVLIAYGEENSDAISNSGIKGSHIPLNTMKVVVIKIQESWRVVIKSVLVKLNKPSGLDAIYHEVEVTAGDKVKSNPHYKEKIRQVLQRHFTKVNKGIYTISLDEASEA